MRRGRYHRLAPEHPFPAGLDDAEDVLRRLWTEDPGRPLGVAGDSAGASLTAGLALRARDQHFPLTAQLLLYPATDPAMASPSMTEKGAGYFLTRRDMAWFYQQYLPAGPASAPEADLAHADVAGVAPAIVATAEFDPLRDEGSAYAERLTAPARPLSMCPAPGSSTVSPPSSASSTPPTLPSRLDDLVGGGGLGDVAAR